MKGGAALGELMECYAVPDWEALELPKPAMKRLQLKSLSWFRKQFSGAECSFNERKCENLDMVATYRPYHFNGTEFGMYLYVDYFVALLLDILDKTPLSLSEAHAFSLECVHSHGAFHYLVERYTERSSSFRSDTAYIGEIGFARPLSHFSLYRREVYSRIWGTLECYEETLANAYLFQNHPEWSETRHRYVQQLFVRQQEGYAQAAYLDQEALSAYYALLEKQIGGQGALSLEQWIRQQTPFQSGQIPVYLVHEGLAPRKFERILEIFFPACFEIT